MICPKCGKTVPDGAVCACSSSQLYSSNPAVNVLKTVCASPLALCLLVLQIVQLVVSVVAEVMSTSSSLLIDAGEIERWFPGLNNYGDLSYLGGERVLDVVIGFIPKILVIVAIALIHFAAKDKSTGGMRTTGFSILRGLYIVMAVLLTITSVVVIIAGILVMLIPSVFNELIRDFPNISGWAYSFSLGIVGFVVLLVGIILLAVGLPYCISFIRTLGRAKTVALTGVPDNRVSSFLMVILSLFAAFSLISGVRSLYWFPLTGIESILNSVSFVVVVMCLSNYKKQMTQVMYTMPFSGGYQHYPYPQHPGYPPAGSPYAQPQQEAPYAQPPHPQPDSQAQTDYQDGFNPPPENRDDAR